MKNLPFKLAAESIFKRDQRYAPRAYVFLREVLDFTLKQAAKSHGYPVRNVTGAEFCIGFRDLAIQQFGAKAGHLMSEWGLHETADIGEMVFNLIEEEIFSKQDSETRQDFATIYDFNDAFVVPFQ